MVKKPHSQRNGSGFACGITIQFGVACWMPTTLRWIYVCCQPLGRSVDINPSVVVVAAYSYIHTPELGVYEMYPIPVNKLVTMCPPGATMVTCVHGYTYDHTYSTSSVSPTSVSKAEGSQ